MNPPMRWLALCAVGLSYSTTPGWSNGFSFYEKAPKIENGKLVLDHPPEMLLPRGNQELLACRKRNAQEQPGCLSDVQKVLYTEISAERDPNRKAARYFLLGSMQFEIGRSTQAVSAFHNVLRITNDKPLRQATLFRLGQVGAMLTDATLLSEAVTGLRQESPVPAQFPADFRTYPLQFCLLGTVCVGFEPEPLDRMEQRLTIVKKIDELRAKRNALSLEKNRTEYVENVIGTGKLYEQFCPVESMFVRLCPQAAELYKEIVDKAPDAQGADYAYLQLQEGKFSYEYEGDMDAYSHDVIANYGPFLERYPKSPLAADVRKKYESAERHLKGVSSINSASDPQLASIRALEDAVSEGGVGPDAELIHKVASFRDPRAVKALLGAIQTGRMATDGLAALGDAALSPVIEVAKSGDPLKTVGAEITLSSMLKPENIKNFSDQNAARTRIRETFEFLSKSQNKFAADSARSQLEKMK